MSFLRSLSGCSDAGVSLCAFFSVMPASILYKLTEMQGTVWSQSTGWLQSTGWSQSSLVNVKFCLNVVTRRTKRYNLMNDE